MKKMMMLAAVAAMMSVNAFAQQNCPQGDCEEKMENLAERIANCLGLDEKTADKFEEDYKKMMMEHKEVMDNHREKMGCCDSTKCCRPNGKKGKKDVRRKKMECQSTVDADKRLESMLDMRQKKLDIVKKYSKKMGKYLNDDQVLQVMTPMLCPGNRGAKGCMNGKHHNGHAGQYQQGQRGRNYDGMVRRPRK